jgi:DNA-directed RNA polymerase specialized sigma24 family protein
LGSLTLTWRALNAQEGMVMNDDELPRKGVGRASAIVPLWISAVDERNMPVDPVFLEAAYQIAGDFLTYRQRDLNDESLALQLAEKAVHKASRALQRGRIEKPVAYLFRTFTSLVDRAIRRSKRQRPLSEAIGATADPEAELEIQLEWSELLESVEPAMQRILQHLRRGWTQEDVARELGIKPNTLRKSVSRMMQDVREKWEVKERLDGSRTKARRSGRDEEEGPENHAGRNLPPDGLSHAA